MGLPHSEIPRQRDSVRWGRSLVEVYLLEAVRATRRRGPAGMRREDAVARGNPFEPSLQGPLCSGGSGATSAGAPVGPLQDGVDAAGLQLRALRIGVPWGSELWAQQILPSVRNVFGENFDA